MLKQRSCFLSPLRCCLAGAWGCPVREVFQCESRPSALKQIRSSKTAQLNLVDCPSQIWHSEVLSPCVQPDNEIGRGNIVRRFVQLCERLPAERAPLCKAQGLKVRCGCRRWTRVKYHNRLQGEILYGY